MPSSLPTHSLSRTLADWRVTPPRDPNFRAGVWGRIGQRSRESWAGYLRAHVGSWSLAAAVALGGASWAGHAVAQARLQHEREAMVVSYLVDLDPRMQAKVRP